MGRMIHFRLLGIPVTVQPFFWLTLAIIGGALRIDSREGMIYLLFFISAGFISILVHELGHALMAIKFGARTEIVLQAFGGYAAYSGVRMSRGQGAMITAAGPLLQLALGSIAYFLLKSGIAMPDNARIFIWLIFIISYVWAVLNLLPVIPMDGGRLVEAALGPRRVRLTLMISLVTAVSVGILAWTLYRQPILAIFMGYFGWLSYKELQRFR
jgi:stage IV sporulation protein FB